MLELKEVTKEYNKIPVIQDVNITVEEGDLFSIIGPSGSGKTTLLNLLTGFLEPTRGQALYYSKITHEAKDMTKNLHRIKNHIGFTPQHNSFYPKLTVKENLLHFGRLYGIKTETLKNNIKSLLEFTQLTPHQNKLAEHLSGGMQKRLDISCSLVHKPKMLVLDEPTAELDPHIRAEILNLLKEVNKQGITIIFATNHLDAVEKVSNKIAIIHKGKVKTYGSLEEIRKPYLRDHFTINLQHLKSKEALVQALQKMSINKIIDEDDRLVVYPQDVEKTLQRVLSIIKSDNLYLHDIDLHQPTIHEIFEKIDTE